MSTLFFLIRGLDNGANYNHYIRQPDNQWLLSEASQKESKKNLSSINCRLTLVEVYDKVEIRQ
jgi:hypothetical protein